MQYLKDKKQTMIYKAKLKIEQQKLQCNQEWATVFRKGNQFPLHLCMVVFYLFGFQRQYLSFLYHRLWVTQWVSYKKQQQLSLREYLLSPVFAAYPSRAPVVTRVCCLSFASTCCHPCLLLILREHQCLFFSAVFCESVFVFSSISSSINGFWLPLWYL
jgi:hypothetical protein